MHKTKIDQILNKTEDKTNRRSLTNALLIAIPKEKTPSLEANCSSGRKKCFCNV
jgi:hypothetical protein